ncbi:unnamed protein product [Kuraishia capsulata CBS 1993]|uniref:tRNA-splicing endonuclease subunit Sen54 N-terminal domain-containing protein n=1 Tax=Kuraishia capsulata CBS 1993 TaxID=1382522 RepID=W6MFM3_9ASCO|nr:uncharacterized protein KUCA_T00000373001 [Kuraishia capsulata CBS 1993]CDK24411.1 unnamed protein product [Kuraishia capsulata CBS 1993]
MEQEEDDLLNFDSSNQPDDDFGEVIQDWAVVAQKYQGKKRNTVPKRGVKDAEPLAQESTTYDERMLSEARNTMYEALSKTRRVPVPGNGSMDPLTIRYDRQTGEFYMTQPKGKFLETLGKTDRDGKTVWMFPEEAVFLVERGSCIAKYSDDDSHVLSLEELYSMAFANPGDYEKFMCYSHLKRCGYTIQRHAEYDEMIPLVTEVMVPVLSTKRFQLGHLANYLTRSLSWFRRLILPLVDRIGLFCFNGGLSRYPLLHPQHFEFSRYFRYSSMFSQLQTVFLRPSSHQEVQANQQTKYRICFNIWKPTPGFRKKSPPVPDFQVCVIDVNSTNFPSFEEVRSLLGRCDSHTVKKVERTSVATGPDDFKLKYGEKHILICIIDQGVMNFVRLNDSSFASEGLIWQDQWLQKKKFAPRKGGRKNRRKQ